VEGQSICECSADPDCPVDSNLCNGYLVCSKQEIPYTCVVAAGSKIVCPEPVNSCVIAVCDPLDGSCDGVPVDGKPCDDQDPCTSNDLCSGGKCAGLPGMCQCTTNEDCLPKEDGNLCNGTLKCDTQSFPYSCKVDPTTIINCPPASSVCKKSQCVPASGECVEVNLDDGAPCDDGDKCTGGDSCSKGVCVPGTVNQCACPEDMVLVDGKFCMDTHEASRVDATPWYQGMETTKPVSKAGVIPWYPVDLATVITACTAVEKRVCTEAEVTLACGGPNGWKYLYGDKYSATVCNGIDAFCDCENEYCIGIEECPYPHCYSSTPEGEWGGCGASFHVTPTGSFPACVNAWIAYDVNGNVWELVDIGNGESWYKGGAFNCGDSEYLHNCQERFQNISAKGFRCCKDADIVGGGK